MPRKVRQGSLHMKSITGQTLQIIDGFAIVTTIAPSHCSRHLKDLVAKRSAVIVEVPQLMLRAGMV